MADEVVCPLGCRNYVKFLVDREGRPVRRYTSTFDPIKAEDDVSPDAAIAHPMPMASLLFASMLSNVQPVAASVLKQMGILAPVPVSPPGGRGGGGVPVKVSCWCAQRIDERWFGVLKALFQMPKAVFLGCLYTIF